MSVVFRSSKTRSCHEISPTSQHASSKPFESPNLPGHGIVGQMHVGLSKHWSLRLRVGEGMAKTQEVLLRMEKNLANRGVEVVLAEIHILQVNL